LFVIWWNRRVSFRSSWEHFPSHYKELYLITSSLERYGSEMLRRSILHMLTLAILHNILPLRLSPRKGASPGCGWRTRTPDMKSSFKYIE
jgi:hypothetical protein